MLGKSEMMISHRDFFAAGRPQAADLPQAGARADAARPRLTAPRPTASGRAAAAEDERASRDAALELGPHPHLIVSRTGRADVRQPARRARCSASRLEDIGRPFQDLMLSYQPVELRSAVDEALRERRRVALGEARFTPDRRRRAHARHHASTPLQADGGAARRQHRSSRTSPATRALQRELEGNRARPRARLRGAAVDDRRARDDQRGAPVRQRGAADDQRGAPVDQRGARDDERGAPVDQRGARDDQRRAARPHGRAQPRQRLPRGDPHRPAASASRWSTATSACRSGTDRAEELWGLRAGRGASTHHLLSLDIGLPSEQLAQPLRAVLGGRRARSSRSSWRPSTAAGGRSAARRRSCRCAPPATRASRGAIMMMEDLAGPARTDGAG